MEDGGSEADGAERKAQLVVLQKANEEVASQKFHDPRREVV